MSIISIKGDHTTTKQRNTRIIKHGLVHCSRCILPTLLAVILLIGCGPTIGANAQPGATATHKAASNPSPTSTSVNLATSQCPAELKDITTCYTPQVFRAAYGVDKLIQQGFTGKVRQ